MFKLNLKYLIWGIVLFFVLVFIAVFVKDQFIRPFMGDVLVVIWLYLLLKSFLDLKYKTAASIVLIFAFSIETLQYFQLVKILGLQEYRVARIVIGSTFDMLDFLAYFIGFITIWISEKVSSTIKK